MIRLLLCMLMFAATPLRAEEIVLGISRDEVAITATFDGSDLLIFGAIKREEPIPAGEPVEVIVAVSGPREPLEVHRKDRRWGIWVNADRADIDAAPSFYAVATSGPLEDVLSQTSDLRHAISLRQSIRLVGANVDAGANFTDALMRIRQDAGLYVLLEGGVELSEQTLFRTQIELPANLTEGDYNARIFLTRDGEVIDQYTTPIPVNKVGLERWLFEMARDRSALYGLMSLAIAIFAGWSASAAFTALRRR